MARARTAAPRFPGVGTGGSRDRSLRRRSCRAAAGCGRFEAAGVIFGNMLNRRCALYFAPLLFLVLACTEPSAQSPKDPESLRKEIEALKAQQAEMQKSLEEVREFLKA